MSIAGNRAPIVAAQTATWNFSCRCGREISFDIDREVGEPRDRDFEVNQIEQKVLCNGWVSRRMEDNDGRQHVFAYCSKGCHNDYVRAQHRREVSDGWWKRRGFAGAQPPCICWFALDAAGFLVLLRASSCPLHTWWDEYTEASAKCERDLFEKWKDVPVGTIVVRRDDGRAGCVSEPPRLVSYSFGGWPHVLVPVEGWAPHPHALDLMLPPGDGWRWLPPKISEVDG